MNSFQMFQSFFYQFENGRLYENREGVEIPFYIKYYSESNGRIDKFSNKLESFLNQNGFSFSESNFANSVEHLEISYLDNDPKTRSTRHIFYCSVIKIYVHSTITSKRMKLEFCHLFSFFSRLFSLFFCHKTLITSCLWSLIVTLEWGSILQARKK